MYVMLLINIRPCCNQFIKYKNMVNNRYASFQHLSPPSGGGTKKNQTCLSQVKNNSEPSLVFFIHFLVTRISKYACVSQCRIFTLIWPTPSSPPPSPTDKSARHSLESSILFYQWRLSSLRGNVPGCHRLEDRRSQIGGRKTCKFFFFLIGTQKNNILNF